MLYKEMKPSYLSNMAENVIYVKCKTYLKMQTIDNNEIQIKHNLNN